MWVKLSQEHPLGTSETKVFRHKFTQTQRRLLDLLKTVALLKVLLLLYSPYPRAPAGAQDPHTSHGAFHTGCGGSHTMWQPCKPNIHIQSCLQTSSPTLQTSKTILGCHSSPTGLIIEQHLWSRQVILLVSHFWIFIHPSIVHLLCQWRVIATLRSRSCTGTPHWRNITGLTWSEFFSLDIGSLFCLCFLSIDQLQSTPHEAVPWSSLWYPGGVQWQDPHISNPETLFTLK